MPIARAIAGGAGWVDHRARGRVRLAGRDAVTFLHALVSQDIAGLTCGTGCYATYLTPQGRMIADMRIYHRGESLLLDVAPGIAPALATRLDSLIFSEDARVTDESAAWAQIGVIGGGSAEVLARALGANAAALAALDTWAHVSLDAIASIRSTDAIASIGSTDAIADAWIARTDDAPVPSFDVFVPAGGDEAVIARLGDVGAVPFTGEVAEALRIEAGRPSFGIDMTAETIPLEAGLLARAISTTKGCYVGQEVIIRILHRGGGRVAKRLVRLVFDEGAGVSPLRDTPITSDGLDIGRLTSTAFSPVRNRVVALGYVQRDDAEPGRRVTVAGAQAEIVALAG